MMNLPTITGLQRVGYADPRWRVCVLGHGWVYWNEKSGVIEPHRKALAHLKQPARR